MKIDYTENGKVKFCMKDYIKQIISAAPNNMLKGASSTPAAHHLFEINEEGVRLTEEQKVLFHHLVAKLLYLAK